MKMLPSIKKALVSSIKINIALLLLLITVLCYYIPIKSDHDWKSGISRGIDQLRNMIVYSKTSIFIQEGTAYPLVFPENASFATGDGICLTDSNFTWLMNFKDAISNCSVEGEYPSVLVRGFSSVAPFSDSSSDDEKNCEVANRRAEAVVSLLASDPGNISSIDQKCIEAERFSQEIKTKGKLCERKSEKFEYGPEDIGFNITYIPWKSFHNMLKERPVNDGTPASDGTIKNRRKELEFLNRVVYMTVTNDACWHWQDRQG